MFTPKKPTLPGISESAEAIKTLFDPFLNAGQFWQKAPEAGHPPRCEVVFHDALNHLAAMAKQFQSPAPGWKALLLAPPGFHYTVWANQPKAALIEALVPEIITLTHDAWVYVLPNNQLVLLLFQPQHSGLVGAVYRLAGLLVGEEAAPRTRVTLLDLEKEPGKLAHWPLQMQHAIGQQAQTQAKAKQQALELQIAAMLAPANLQACQGRRLGRTKPVVLVVEDDPSTSLLLETLLAESVLPIVAHSGLEAARAYEQHGPDLVFLDLGLPDVTGLQVLQAIRAGEPAARVVVLTANATKANLEAARQYGVQGFMAKPFTRAKLQETLQQQGLLRNQF